jgi:cell division transport system permease protein
MMNAEAQPARRANILPRESGAAPLDFVIGVMAFLAALSLGFVLIANRTAQGWEAGLAGRLTVQIVPQEGVTTDSELEAALNVLRATDGVAQATAQDKSYSLSLIQPWLGKDIDLGDLPIPRLIDVVLKPGSIPDIAALTARLKAAAPHATLDDHSRWIERLRTTAGTIVWSTFAVMTLIAGAMAAIVAFATRAGLAAHHEIVQLLHLMGARHSFISRAFERHYLIAAFVAALAGTILAGAAFLLAGGLEQANLATANFLPPLGLTGPEWLWLPLVPIVAALIAWATAHISVFSALNAFY